MAVKDYKTNPNLNTNVNGIDIAEGCAPRNINDAIRNVMADTAELTSNGLLGAAPSLSSSVSFDGLTTGEAYYQTGGAHPDSPFPGLSCLLWVKQIGATSCQQVCYSIGTGRIMQRYYNGSWLAWKEIVNPTVVSSVTKALTNGQLGEAILMPSGVDLNTLIEPGVYRASTAVLNAPFASQFIHVMKHDGYVRQVAYRNTGTLAQAAQIASRLSADTGATWSGWVRIDLYNERANGLLGTAITLLDTESLNTKIDGEGHYVINGTHPNNPFPGLNCLVWSKQTWPNRCNQLVISLGTGKMAQRYYNGSWLAWRYVASPDWAVLASAYINGSTGAASTAYNIVSSSRTGTGAYTIKIDTSFGVGGKISVQLRGASSSTTGFAVATATSGTINVNTFTTANVAVDRAFDFVFIA